MTRDSRQRYIKSMMERGMPFEKVYQTSDGIPRFKWWIYPEGTNNGYLSPSLSEEELTYYLTKCPEGTTFRREDILGYEIDD